MLFLPVRTSNVVEGGVSACLASLHSSSHIGFCALLFHASVAFPHSRVKVVPIACSPLKEHGCGPGRMDKVPHPVVHEGLAGRLCHIDNLAGIGCNGLMYMRSDQSSGV